MRQIGPKSSRTTQQHKAGGGKVLEMKSQQTFGPSACQRNGANDVSRWLTSHRTYSAMKTQLLNNRETKTVNRTELFNREGCCRLGSPPCSPVPLSSWGASHRDTKESHEPNRKAPAAPQLGDLLKFKRVNLKESKVCFYWAAVGLLVKNKRAKDQRCALFGLAFPQK